MALSRPTLKELIDRVKGDIKAELGITTVLRRTFAFAFGKALAGLSHLLHGHLVFVSRQIFPDQAEDEFMVRWATIFGLTRIAATNAKLDITITGTDGSVIPISTLYQRSDGVTYTTEAEVTIAGGTATATIVADDTGADGNLEVGDAVTLQSPIAGVDAEALVAAINTEGEDEETLDSLRERVLARMQNPPAGGNAADYIAFAREVAGVTRAWVLPNHLGENTVGVSFVEDDDVDIIPDAAKVAEVQANVEVQAPVTALVTVFAPSPKVLDMTIAIKPNTIPVQQAVTSELEDLLRRDAQVAGSYQEVGVSYDGIIRLSRLNEAISIASGEEDHVIISPTADVIPQTGELVILGTITWQTL